METRDAAEAIEETCLLFMTSSASLLNPGSPAQGGPTRNELGLTHQSLGLLVAWSYRGIFLN